MLVGALHYSFKTKVRTAVVLHRLAEDSKERNMRINRRGLLRAEI